MPTQITIALCEGPHDVSFICKILKSNGFVSNEHLKINQFPQPMDTLMAQEVVKTDVEELNLQEVRKGFLPTHTLQKGDAYVFLYSMGGDGKRAARQSILKSLPVTVRQEGEIKKGRIPDDTELSVLYFFDADAQGIPARLAQVNAEVREVITSIQADIFTANTTYSSHEGIKLGCCIFTGADNTTGKLEDILVPLMKDGNDVIFDEALGYLNTHFSDPRLFPLKLSTAANVTTEVRSIRAGDKYRYDEKKSILGVVGQLQKSGKSNTTCISDTDYLTLAKIQGNAKCQEIITFINNVINNT